MAVVCWSLPVRYTKHRQDLVVCGDLLLAISYVLGFSLKLGAIIIEVLLQRESRECEPGCHAAGEASSRLGRGSAV